MALAGLGGKGNGVASAAKFTTVVNMHETITITATEANRNFSKLLREVEQGHCVTITSHGRKIASMSPVEDEDAKREKRIKALAALKAHWATMEHVTIGPWTREELYERD